MKQITRKLRSRRGATLLLAMVFMLFAMFVGGTILAAASANSYRMEHMSDQQTYLDQRSAALLIADSLDHGDAVLTVSIIDIETKTWPLVISDGGVWDVDYTATPQVSNTITVKTTAGLVMTPMQRLLVESAVGAYLQEMGIGLDQITLSGLDYEDKHGNTKTVQNITDFWLYSADGTPTVLTSGSIQVSGESTDVDLTGSTLDTGYTANFQCKDGAELFDFVVDFGESSQIIITMDGYHGNNNPVTSKTRTEDASGNPVEQHTTTNRVEIYWQASNIEKGSVSPVETEPAGGAGT